MMDGKLDLQYMAAVGLMVMHGRGSTSYVQRTLGIGYNAAARLIERMEADGILAKPNYVGKREVLVRAGGDKAVNDAAQAPTGEEEIRNEC